VKVLISIFYGIIFIILECMSSVDCRLSIFIALYYKFRMYMHIIKHLKIILFLCTYTHFYLCIRWCCIEFNEMRVQCQWGSMHVVSLRIELFFSASSKSPYNSHIFIFCTYFFTLFIFTFASCWSIISFRSSTCELLCFLLHFYNV
jgi:hypothetical protein